MSDGPTSGATLSQLWVLLTPTGVITIAGVVKDSTERVPWTALPDGRWFVGCLTLVP